jgi:hypothetical protein
MRSAVFCKAADAVGARETTPAEMIATSGTRVTSPVALMSRRVPAIVCVIDACWALAADGKEAALIISAATRAFFMAVPLKVRFMARTVADQAMDAC